MKSLFITVFISLVCLSFSAFENLSGVWNTGNQNTQVKMEKHNEVFEGRIISTDSDNTKPGALIVKEVKYVKGEWVGKIYAPKRDEWYNAKFRIVDDKLTITITVGFFSKTVEWTEVKEI